METILTATDFSAASNNAVAYAAALANSINAKLVLFNAYHVPVPSGEVPIVIFTPQELEGDLMKKMEGIKKHLQVNYPTLSIEIDFTPGFAAEEINAAAVKYKATCTVLGLRGAGELSEIMIGSTATDILKNTKVPTIIVPEDAKFLKPKSFVLATDLKSVLPKAMEQLNFWLTTFNAKLSVVNVVKPNSLPVMQEAVAGIYIEHALSNTDHELFFPENESVTEGINSFISKHPCDLLVMMPHKHSFWDSLIHERHTKQMAFHTRIPLLAIPN